MTDNSNDSEQNLQLLKLDSSSQKGSETIRELENCATCKNQPFAQGKERKLGLPFNYAVVIVLSHLQTNIGYSGLKPEYPAQIRLSCGLPP